MKLFLTILLSLTIISKGVSQNIPPEYKLLKTLAVPTEFKTGAPGRILIDDIKGYLLMEYDFNPTYLVLYDMKTWNKIYTFKTKAFVYLDNSYFFGNLIYIDKGRWKSKYIKIDLNTFKETKATCDDVPRGCEYLKKTVEPKSESSKDKEPYYQLTNYGEYIIVNDSTNTHIYIK